MKADRNTRIADARLYVHGRGATEREAFLEAAHRIKAHVEGLTAEALAELLMSNWDSFPAIEPPTEDDFGALGWSWET